MKKLQWGGYKSSCRSKQLYLRNMKINMVDGFTFLARTLFLLSRLGPLERNGKDTVGSFQFNSILFTQNQFSSHRINFTHTESISLTQNQFCSHRINFVRTESILLTQNQFCSTQNQFCSHRINFVHTESILLNTE